MMTTSAITWAPRTDDVRSAVAAGRDAALVELSHSLEARIHEHAGRLSGRPRGELVGVIAGALATLRGQPVDHDEIDERTRDLDDTALVVDAAKLDARAEIWREVLERGREVEVALRARDAADAPCFGDVDAFRALAPSARREILRSFYVMPPRPREWVEELYWARAPDFA